MEIIGYGEDALTLWALKQHTSKILEKFHDNTPISECLIFYRPSFGRHSKANSSVFGEFDAIISSKENIYLIESKWDNFSEYKNEEFILRDEQILRHEIFSWYLTCWNSKYSNNWQSFINENQESFPFPQKSIAPNGSLLAQNLEHILTRIHKHYNNLSEKNIKNVFLFFYNAEKSKPPTIINDSFRLIPIRYNEEIKDNFVTLFSEGEQVKRMSDEKMREQKRHLSRFLNFDLHGYSDHEECKKYRYQVMINYLNENENFLEDEHLLECSECESWKYDFDNRTLQAEYTTEMFPYDKTLFLNEE